jgi:hypothetical protein
MHTALLREVTATSPPPHTHTHTRDGAGILVSRDVYEGIRQAQPSDVRTVEEIIRPLEDQV